MNTKSLASASLINNLNITTQDGEIWFDDVLNKFFFRIETVPNVFTDIEVGLSGGVQIVGGLALDANYPEATAGQAFIALNDGQIGGVAGPQVKKGEMILCITDTAGGDEEAAGADYSIQQLNIDLTDIRITGGEISGLTFLRSALLTPNTEADELLIGTLSRTVAGSNASASRLLGGDGADDAALGGSGGLVNTQGGVGGDGTALASTGGAGGSNEFQAGTGGSGGATGGAGGEVEFEGCTGGASSDAGGTGGTGGRAELQGGTGGADGEGTSGTGGKGGDVDLLVGSGGAGNTPGQRGFINETSGFVKSRTETALVAFAGGGQANALLLDATNNKIDTVLDAADSVRFPVAEVGMDIVVQNANPLGNAVDVFPAVGGEIDGGGVDAAISLANGSFIRVVCYVVDEWELN